MTGRAKEFSARAKVFAFWDNGDARTDAELAAALGVVAYTVRGYRRDWNRKNGNSTSSCRLSPKIVAVAWEMRQNNDMAYPDIAKVIKEKFGIQASAELVRLSCLRSQSRKAGVVDVTEEMLPLRMRGGTCYAVAIVPPNTSNAHRYRNEGSCNACPRLEQCRAAVWGWDGRFIGCERPLEFELMEVGQ